MPSKIYLDLHKRTGKLKSKFVNFEQDPSGQYNFEESIRATSFIVLAHAELEWYFERWSMRFLQRIENSWNSKGKVSEALLHIVRFYSKERNVPTSIPSTDIWSEAITDSVIRHRSVIDNNNGIKRDRICSLFHPYGFRLNDYEAYLLEELHTFGKDRGQFAHKPHSEYLGPHFDPFIYFDKLQNIISAIPEFDEKAGEFSARL
jgi:hypothetical protein